jgi:hypothetical protein
MKKIILFICCLSVISLIVFACNKSDPIQPPPTIKDSSLVNTSHLDYLYIPVAFSTGTAAAGIFIYSEAPDYHRVGDADEGFTCVDDVSRAVLVYIRSNNFNTDTATQSKVYHLLHFILEMQSGNGYFYNFLFTNNSINTTGGTSANNANWWSWRALQTLTEAAPLIQSKNASLAGLVNAAVDKLIARIKLDQVNLPTTTKIVNGITVPQWLPAGSGTDQAAVLILALVNYCTVTDDPVIKAYIKKLADGIVMMQQGDATQFPYACFLSWENTWHAYASDQAYALFQAGAFLNDQQYSTKAIAEVDNFYPWLLQNGFKASFAISKSGSQFSLSSEKSYDQIAYGCRPMVFAAIEAYKITGQEKYADMAGHLAAWFLGANDAGAKMYDLSTGRGYDGISSSSSINQNSGAESTIEALLTFQRVEKYSAVKTALNKYKK